MLTIIGPTASGKTALAVAVADRLHTEIISGDSRQVYRGMDIGTGKDLGDYTIGGRQIPHHLIDIVPAGAKYTVYDFQRDFLRAYNDITARGMQPVFCGGSGLYIESVLRSYQLYEVPQNPQLRASLEGKSLEELTAILSTYKTLHNKTDVDSPQRAIRAIEIAEYNLGVEKNRSKEVEANVQCPKPESDTAMFNVQCSMFNVRSFPTLPNTTVGIDIPRDLRRQRITERLHRRLDEGMLAEVQSLLDGGIAPQDLIYYGLEYRFLTLHLIGQLTYDQMVHDLEIAIHQFAKRQMTWFRGMERRGLTIHWIDGTLPLPDLVNATLALYQSEQPS